MDDESSSSSTPYPGSKDGNAGGTEKVQPKLYHIRRTLCDWNHVDHLAFYGNHCVALDTNRLELTMKQAHGVFTMDVQRVLRFCKACEPDMVADHWECVPVLEVDWGILNECVSQICVASMDMKMNLHSTEAKWNPHLLLPILNTVDCLITSMRDMDKNAPLTRNRWSFLYQMVVESSSLMLMIRRDIDKVAPQSQKNVLLRKCDDITRLVDDTIGMMRR